MLTQFLTLDPENFDPNLLQPVVQSLREGGVVAFPTETVYGMGVHLKDPQAVRRLLELRKSSADRAITIHIADREDLRHHISGGLPVMAQRLIRQHWPGPLTILVEEGEKTSGFRLPDHPVARALLRAAGIPIGAPSANYKGDPPATDAEGVREKFDGRIDWILDGGPCRYSTASTIVRIRGREMELVREGAIPREEVEHARAKVILFVCTGNTCRSPMAVALFRKLLSDSLGISPSQIKEHGFRILSAGTAAAQGSPASRESEIAAEELGGNLSAHQSSPISISMAEDADHIFTMTARHRDQLLEWMPDLSDRIELLDPSGGDVSDPIGSSLDVYRETAVSILAFLRTRLDGLIR